MVASIDIKFYVHTNNNAPQLQNTYGSMINVLDACLVNGINIGTVSSIKASGTTVTALFSSAHNLMQYQVIKITGANQAEFNGEHRILTVPNTQSVTFELAAAPSTTTATGTITASLPSLGWEKPFSSSNPTGGGKAAYRSTNLLLPSRPFLRVVDELDPAYTATYAKYAKVGIVSDMTDINTMLGVQAPYDTANPDKNWVGTGSGATAINGWAKWYYARSVPHNQGEGDGVTPINGDRPFVLIGNKNGFYILNGLTPTDTYSACYGFGVLDNDQNSSPFLSATLYSGTAATGFQVSVHTPLTGSSSISESLNTVCMINNVNAIPTSSSGNGVALTTGAATGWGNLFTNIVRVLPYCIDTNKNIRGHYPLIEWILRTKPYVNNQIFIDDESIYLAKNTFTFSSIESQIAIKIGDL